MLLTRNTQNYHWRDSWENVDILLLLFVFSRSTKSAYSVARCWMQLFSAKKQRPNKPFTNVILFLLTAFLGSLCEHIQQELYEEAIYQRCTFQFFCCLHRHKTVMITSCNETDSYARNCLVLIASETQALLVLLVGTLIDRSRSLFLWRWI